jgi:tripartite-type tricarboxylate transporter receptor subunit TctC
MKSSPYRRMLAAMSLAVLSASAFGQTSFPDKAIRIVVPFAPGGGTDVLTRIVAQQMAEDMKAQIVIENRPGAGGGLGAALVAKAAPDGYTLYVGTTATSMMPSLSKNLSFDPIGDFVPIALIGSSPFILITHNKLPVNNLSDLLALAKAKPGSLSYGSAGNGSINHVGMELFKSMAQVDILHVPYKGSSAALADVLGGQLSMMMDTVVSSSQHVKSGSVKALAVTSLEKASLTPTIPTISEQGVKGFDVTAWYGFVAPKGTPQAVLQRLNTEVNKALANPAVRARYEKLGAEPVPSTLEGFGKMWIAEEKKWTNVVRNANIRSE